MSNRVKIVAIPKTTTTTTTFLPTSIAGCQLWLDGADQTTITGTTTMTSWRDKSTNAYTANSFVNSVAYPSWVSNLQNGNGAVQYSAGNGTSIANFVLAQTMSIFMVYYMINSTNGLFLEHGPDENVTSGFYFYPPGGNNFAINSGTGQVGVNFGNVVIANTWQMIEGINPDPSNSNTMAFYFNGTVKASGATQSGTTTVTKTLYINGRGGANSVSYNAYLGELIIFNTALSATNRQTIESYLAQKWGITSSLPVGHPGLTTPVYTQTITVALPRQKIRTIPNITTVTFLPTSIAGCALWLDGADPTTLVFSSGSNISQWNDKSGNAKNITQPTQANQPSYTAASNSVLFSDTTFLLMGNIAYFNTLFASAYTMFFVHKKLQPFAWLVSPGNYVVTFTATLRVTTAAITDLDYTTPTFSSAATEPVRMFTVQLTGAERNVRMNGQLTAYNTNNNGSTSWTTAPVVDANWRMGGNWNNLSTAGQTQNMYEVIFYNTALGTTQRQTVESYLAQKWGLTSNLPAGHPGLTTTVYGTIAATVRQKIRILPPPAPLVSYTQTFTYTGANQTFAVPATTTSLTVYMWGAGGGGNTNYGGAGAMVQGVLSVTPGETLTIVVGQGGTIDGTTTFGGGGAGGGNMTGTPPTVGIGFSHNGFPQNAGSGGGRSAIQRGGTDPTNDIVVAGGGGGGTYFSSDRGGSATFSGTANAGIGGLPGLGGTQSAGGAGGGTGQYGQGLSGSRGVGGDTYNNNYYNGGGGGGGGYYGGGGGGTNGGDGAGGGGGSSLTSTLSLISGQSVLGFNSTNGYTAPNNTSPYYASGVGNGAPAINSNPRAGGNGLIVLVYMA